MYYYNRHNHERDNLQNFANFKNSRDESVKKDFKCPT